MILLCNFTYLKSLSNIFKKINIPLSKRRAILYEYRKIDLFLVKNSIINRLLEIIYL